VPDVAEGLLQQGRAIPYTGTRGRWLCAVHVIASRVSDVDDLKISSSMLKVLDSATGEVRGRRTQGR
jgi:hypothetical protein